MDNRSICRYYDHNSFPVSMNCFSDGRLEYDDGPYFDMDFGLPLCCNNDLASGACNAIGSVRASGPFADEDEDDEFEFNFSISATATTRVPNPLQCISPADNLFYKGQLLPLHLPPRLQMVRTLDVEKGLSALQLPHAERAHFPSLLRSATKFKVSLFGFRKSSKVAMDVQAACAGRPDCAPDSPAQKQPGLFTVKFKVVEVPLVSLFTRDASRGPSGAKPQKKADDSEGPTSAKNAETDKRRAKEIVHKYMRMIKPLYVKISQKYAEKSRFSQPLSADGENAAKNCRRSGSERGQSEFSISGHLRTACKQLGKSKCRAPVHPSPCHRTDSTVLELQNAIQGAIAHCKQSNCTDDAPTVVNVTPDAPGPEEAPAAA